MHRSLNIVQRVAWTYVGMCGYRSVPTDVLVLTSFTVTLCYCGISSDF